MRRYERASTMLTSNRPVEDWGKLLGDAARAVSACSTAYCTTDTCSNVALGAGEPKPTCLHRRRQGRTNWSRTDYLRWPLLR